MISLYRQTYLGSLLEDHSPQDCEEMFPRLDLEYFKETEAFVVDIQQTCFAPAQEEALFKTNLLFTRLVLAGSFDFFCVRFKPEISIETVKRLLPKKLESVEEDLESLLEWSGPVYALGRCWRSAILLSQSAKSGSNP